MDIDGVLNTMHHLRRQKKETGFMSSNNWCPIACRHVTLLCEQFDARIVISSTWRYNHTDDELRELLSDNEIDPGWMVGTTPSLIHEKEMASVCRGDEIASWLKEYKKPISSYVIIDDAPPSQFLKNQQPNLVHVEQEKGFAQKEAAVKAEEILGNE